MSVEELKNYLRVDHDFDDSLLASLQASALAYVEGAIDKEDVVDPRLDLTVALLVGHWYKNREASSTENLHNLPLGVTSLIQQLRGV